ncbi:hypothetical protein niasHS_000710 [Heterodera schachtii]|uniref:Uncharacterized protein n=1 Tax=Heterodera schachtii TaxID=97005 RepID=A0ABD2KBG7_HETSC
MMKLRDGGRRGGELGSTWKCASVSPAASTVRTNQRKAMQRKMVTTPRPSLNCGYVLLPSSAVDDAPPSPPASTPTATSPTHCQSNWLLPPPPPAATELDSIQHKPNDFNLDRVKTEEIKQIMAQMSVSSRKPEWAQQIVDRLKKGKVTDGK